MVMFFFKQEIEQSAYNFEHSDAKFLLSAFESYEKQASSLVSKSLALPAYEQVLKAAHTFNLLDARGVISVQKEQTILLRLEKFLVKLQLHIWIVEKNVASP